MTKQRSSSSRSGGGASSASAASNGHNDDLTSLLRLPTRDIADRLNAMLETGRRPHYAACGDYLLHGHNGRRHHHRGESCSQMSSASQSRCTASQGSRGGRSSRRQRDDSRITDKNNQEEQQHGTTTTTVTPASRAAIICWLSDCADYLDLSPECIAAAAGYVDRFMSSSSSSLSSGCCSISSSHHRRRRSSKKSSEKIVRDAKRDPTVYQLIAISSLFLASKQHSAKLSLADATIFARVSHGSYSAREILDMEGIIVDALGWRLCGPTVRSLACHFVALLSRQALSKKRNDYDNKAAPKNRRRVISTVVDFAMLRCDLALSDYGLSVLHSNEDVALASVLGALERIPEHSTTGEGGCELRRAFDRAVFDWCGMDVRSDTVEDARDALRDLMDRQETKNDGSDHAVASSSMPSTGDDDDDDDDATKERSFYSARSPVCVNDADELGARRATSRKEREHNKPHPSSSSSRRLQPKDTVKDRNNGRRSRRRVPLEP